MTLRARITLIVVVSFVAMAAGIMLGSFVLERSLRAQYGQAVVAGDQNTWTGLLENDLQRLRPQVELLANKDGVVQAVGARDHDRLGEILGAEIRRLTQVFGTRTVPQFEVMTNRGIVLFGVHSGGNVLTMPMLRQAAGRSGTLAGLARLSDDQLVTAVLAPVYTREGLAAYIALWLPIEQLLENLSFALSAEVELVPEARAAALKRPKAELIESEDGRELMQAEFPLIDLVGQVVGALRTAHDVTEEQRRLDLVRLFSYGAVGCALLLLAGFLQWYMRQAFTPLIGVIRVLNALARGDRQVSFQVPRRRDEIGRLADTVSAFRGNLVDLEQTRAAKQRIESELAVAREIQLNLVPNGRAVFPGHDEIRLHAVMEPARAVGGDLYDFFMIGSDRLFFMIGDVSDKGVPSALFMAIVRTVIKAKVESSDLPLERLIAAANYYLCHNNPSEMFVTVFAATLDLQTGLIEYCDGGHEPPLIWRRDGRVELVEKVGGMALGWADDFPYRSARLQLVPGDTLVLYTDGVTEATNEQQTMFSAERVVEMLGGLDQGAEPEIATRRILNEVRAFSGPVPQSDDITILALQYQGRARETTLVDAAE